MKKLLSLLLSLLLTVTVATNNCTHKHDENCGYDESTETGCTHECDDQCDGIDPHFGYGPDDEHD